MSNRRTFFQYVIPSVLSFALSGVYAIVDGFFVGNSIGDAGLSAINIAYPVTAVLQAVGTGLGMGGAVKYSILKAEGNAEKAREYIAAATWLMLLFSVILTGAVYLASKSLLSALGASGELLTLGRVTDSQGRTVDFKNTIIIMTSNLGSQYLLEGINDKGEIEESARQQVMAQLHQQFRPEFLNRLDEIICFKPLTKTELNGIIDILTSALRQRLEDKSLGLEITDSAKQLIIDRGFDPVFGARPLKRYLQSTVETLIARAILAGDMPAGHVIKVDVRDGELVCE